MLYDVAETVRDKAIQVLLDLRTVLNENDHILNLTLKLSHDDNEDNRVSALKILTELAPDLGLTLCESFIVPEIRSLAYFDESHLIR